MPNVEHLKVLDEGVKAWNAWRQVQQAGHLNRADTPRPGLGGADLRGRDLRGVNFNRTVLYRADLRGAIFDHESDLTEADLQWADMRAVDLTLVRFDGADLQHANLSGAFLDGASLYRARLAYAILEGTSLMSADLESADLCGTDLRGSYLENANLSLSILVGTRLQRAVLNGCRVYGASVWNVEVDEATHQQGLIITPKSSLLPAALVEELNREVERVDSEYPLSRPPWKGMRASHADEPEVTVDDLKIAQFIYMLLNNEEIRDIIGTIGKKGVLFLGRFSERKYILEAIRKAVRNRKLIPIVLDFERPTDRDFSETVLTLAGMSRFIIADITRPKSVPMELELTVPNYMIPFVPIIEKGEHPFAMFRDLWQKHRDWVLEPLYYDSVERLVRKFDKAVIEPAVARRKILAARKAEGLLTRTLDDYE